MHVERRAAVLERTVLTALTALVALASQAEAVAGQQGNAAHVHIGHVLDAFGATPDGAGLLSTAVAEAGVAAQHARLAGYDPTNLTAVQRHANHILHAVDPSRIEGGPGVGFGMKRAAEGVARHIDLAASAEGASGNVQTHAAHVAAAATAVARRADAIVEVVERIQNADNYTEGQMLLEQLDLLVGQLTAGEDVDGDGRISWGDGEGGLDHAQQHMGLMAQGEGL